MKFVESHVDAFVAVLNQGSTLPTLATLQELALVTMAISRAGVGYDVVAQDPSYVNPVSLVRVQTAMNGLVSTFWSVSNWKDIVIEILEVRHNIVSCALCVCVLSTLWLCSLCGC